MPHARHHAAPSLGDELVDHYFRVDAPRHRDAIALLEYWRARMAAGGGFVVGRDIPARPIARLLRNVILWEPLAGNADLRVRLAGADVRRRFDMQLKGSLMSQMFSAEDAAVHLKSGFEVIAGGQPMVLDTSLRRGNVEELHTEVLLLPVTARDLKSAWLLASLFYFG
jgi:hypothetical protein